MFDDHLGEEAIAAHDRQRLLPAEAQRALVAGLRANLRGRGRCLDAGVGTGSVALPLARAGVPLVGIDLSRAMLDALRAKAGGAMSLPLVRGDLVRLPFRDGAFGAALAANVFHLIAAWRGAVAELVRIVRPGGLLIVNLGSGRPDDEASASVLAYFHETLGGVYPPGGEAGGLRDAADFDACLASHRAEMLAPLVIRFPRTATLEDVIARLEHNVFAWPSDLDEAKLHRAAAETRAWARGRFGPLDVPQLRERVMTYRLYRLRDSTSGPTTERFRAPGRDSGIPSGPAAALWGSGGAQPGRRER